jgi:hypothetical protein
MIKRAEAELIEKLVRSMTEREGWSLVGWLSSGCEGSLWECVRRRSLAADAG